MGAEQHFEQFYKSNASTLAFQLLKIANHPHLVKRAFVKI